MGVLYEVTAVTGTYTDREGNEKRRYAKLGVVIETKNGPMLKLESIPVTWEGIAYLNEPKPREPAKQEPSGKYGKDAAPFDDEVPF